MRSPWGSAVQSANAGPEFLIRGVGVHGGLEPKSLDLPPECRGGGHRRIFPDIIVHSRGNDSANLLVVEVKKSTNREPRTCDQAKIKGMKREFGYKWGVLIELPQAKEQLSGEQE